MAASHKEISNILQAIEAGKLPPAEMALATVVDVEGSSYRRVGARMLIQQNGNWIGAISGGCLEGNALRRARQIMQSGQAQMVTYDTRTDASAKAIGASLGCNGILRVWIEPLGNPGAIAHLKMLKTAFFCTEIGFFARKLNGGALDNWPNGQAFRFTDLAQEMPEPGLQLQPQEGCQTCTVAGVEHLFSVEKIQPAVRLLIFGAGQDALPLSHLAHQLGWRTAVTDECAAKALPIRFPEADEVLRLNRTDAVHHLQPDAFTAAVLVSHNFGYDKAILDSLLSCSLPYIGLLGPQKRFQRMNAELGGRLQPLSNLHAPIGLDIGAQAPFEIALAIVAEIQAVFAGRKGGHLRARSGFIHARRALQP